MKKCIDCSKILNETMFHKNKSSKDGLQKICKNCKAIRCKDRYENKKDELLKAKNKWRIENDSWVKEYRRKHYLDNKDYILKKKKIWRYQNKEDIYRKRLIWNKNNKEKVLGYKRKRRANKKGLNENFTDSDYVYRLFDNKCFKCDCDKNLQIDHHKPLSKGYILSKKNAVLLCKSCNSSKRSKMPWEFYNNLELEILKYMGIEN